MCRPEQVTDTPLDYYMTCMVCEEGTPKERKACVVCRGKGRIDWGSFCDEIAVQAELANRILALEREVAMLKRKLERIDPITERELKELLRPYKPPTKSVIIDIAK